MIKETIARPGQETTTVPEELEHISGIAARVLRGQELYFEYAEDIRFEDGVWLIPSQHHTTSVYEVRLGRNGEDCECADFEHRHQTCKHIVCATIARAKSRQCAGCGRRFPHREIVEVQEDHESLTFFEGDPVCVGCADAHGIL